MRVCRYICQRKIPFAWESGGYIIFTIVVDGCANGIASMSAVISHRVCDRGCSYIKCSGEILHYDGRRVVPGTHFA
jgi:hypothetical protein